MIVELDFDGNTESDLRFLCFIYDLPHLLTDLIITVRFVRRAFSYCVFQVGLNAIFSFPELTALSSKVIYTRLVLL